MNRTSALFDDRIAEWLEDDPTIAPGLVLETVLAAVPSISQRRARGPFGGVLFGPGLRFAPAGAVLVVAALVILGLALSVIGPPTAPTPAPLPTPIPLVNFDSPLYGYVISHPEGWLVTAADERIIGTNAPFVGTGVADEFHGVLGGPTSNATIVAAMSEVAEGMTLDAWMEQTAIAECGTPTQPQETIEVAGQPATVSTFAQCNGYFHIWVTFVRGNHGFHVVWLNFNGTEIADRQLLDRILATFVPPEPEPAATAAAATLPVPEELIGAWYHPAPGWWWFLRAGDPECVQAVRTELDCAVWQRGTTPREIGIATMSDGDLVVTWRSGFCTRITSTYSVALNVDSLTLVDIGGGCQGGSYAMTRAGTGSAPTEPPKPAP